MSQAISFRRKDSNESNRLAGSVSGSFKGGDSAVSPKWRASPMSFKMGSIIGSLGTRMYPAPGCSPTPGLELQDFKMGSLSSSYDHSRLLQALSTSHSNDEGCSNYTCCGLPLNDLHALLDHFEEHHVLVLDHHTLPAQQQPAVPPIGAFEDLPVGSMEVNDMELDSTDSPLGSGSSSASSQNSSPHLGSQAALSTQAQANSIYPYYADLRNLMASAAATGVPTSMPPSGIVPSDPPTPTSNLSAQLQQAQCIPPSLLFSPAGSPGPSRPQSSAGIAPSATTTNSSSPGSGSGSGNTSTVPDSSTPQDSHSEPAESAVSPSTTETETNADSKLTIEISGVALDPSQVVSGPGIVHPGPPPPTAAPTSLSKPFKCPTPHCNKSYKQANGLKYHMTHGQCCFLPKDFVSRASFGGILRVARWEIAGRFTFTPAFGLPLFFERDQSNQMEADWCLAIMIYRDPALEGLDEIEKDKVERPFGCGVGGCERRYKNMNGLRYHYQHSGAHGAVGLALLAAGTHSVQIAAHNAALGRSAAKLANRHGSVTPGAPSTPGSGSGVKPSGPNNLARQGSVSTPTSPTSASSRSSSVMSTASNATLRHAPNSASSSASPSRAPSGAATPTQGGARSMAGPTSPRSNLPSTRPAAPTQSSTLTTNQYYSQHHQQPGYPYLPPSTAAYPYLPGTAPQAGQQPQYPTGRGPVFPPHHPQNSSMTNTIAAMAGAFGTGTPTTTLGAPFTYAAAVAQPPRNQNQQSQRPHQLLRTTSGAPGAGATGAGAVPVVATSAVTAVGGGSPHASTNDIDMDMNTGDSSVDNEGDFKMQD
ncbi:hypothetical protein FRB99_008439 [Tulasnella sp. 403]|nr:hypothetical protein FRB99_008439 [Tulasnella sp. 403]